jgi:hypothetical protein
MIDCNPSCMSTSEATTVSFSACGSHKGPETEHGSLTQRQQKLACSLPAVCTAKEDSKSRVTMFYAHGAAVNRDSAC